MYQHKNFVKQAGSSHWSKLEFTCLPPARMTITQLMSTRPHMQEARERFKKIGEGHFVWSVVFLQCSEIESDWFQIYQSQFGNPQISPFKFLSCSPCWSKKQDAGKDTSNAKRIFSDNVTCCGKNKRYSNRSHLPQRFKCSSLLACKTPTVQLSICFPTSHSRIHWHTPNPCPADCFQDILFEQAGNSHWKKLAFLRHVKWHICSVGEWKYFPWCQ